MTGRLEYLRDFRPICNGGNVTFGNNANGVIRGYGVLTTGNFSIQKVAYVEGLKHNLISVAQIRDDDHEVLLTKTKSLIMDTNKLILVISP